VLDYGGAEGCCGKPHEEAPEKGDRGEDELFDLVGPFTSYRY